jgi:hypothetical protein
VGALGLAILGDGILEVQRVGEQRERERSWALPGVAPLKPRWITEQYLPQRPHLTLFADVENQRTAVGGTVGRGVALSVVCAFDAGHGSPSCPLVLPGRKVAAGRRAA